MFAIVNIGLTILLLVVAVREYRATYDIIRFYAGFFRRKGGYRNKGFQVAVVAFLGLSIWKLWVALPLFLVGVYKGNKIYYNRMNARFDYLWEAIKFKTPPSFLSEKETKEAKIYKFTNPYPQDDWDRVSKRLGTMMNSDLEIIAHGSHVDIKVYPWGYFKAKMKRGTDKEKVEAIFKSKAARVEGTASSYNYISFRTDMEPKSVMGLKEQFEYILGHPVDLRMENGKYYIDHLKSIATYNLRDVARTKGNKIFVGRAKTGEILVDIEKAMHWLIAATTGGGKSNVLKCIIYQLLLKRKYRFVFLDPKVVELKRFGAYGVYITDPDEILAKLRSLVREVEGVYNSMADNDMDCMPVHTIIVVEEFAELMLGENKKDFSAAIQLLAQKSRAAGYRMLLITQAPYADVMKGPIKINVVERLCGKMPDGPASQVVVGDHSAFKTLSGAPGEMIASLSTGRDKVKTPLVSKECEAWAKNILKGENDK